MGGGGRSGKERLVRRKVFLFGNDTFYFKHHFIRIFWISTNTIDRFNYLRNAPLSKCFLISSSEGVYSPCKAAVMPASNAFSNQVCKKSALPSIPNLSEGNPGKV